MQQLSLKTDQDIILAMAKVYEAIRLEKALSEQEVCSRGGVSKDAIHRFKKGKNIGLKNFIGILRGIDQLERLSLLFPAVEDTFSPLPTKSRAPKKRIRKNKKPETAEGFVWGEDR